MGWFGKLIGTDKAVDNILDKDNGLLSRAGQWVDNLSYTDEEKAKNSIMVKEWGLSQLEALEPFKIVQRILAFAVTFFWILVGINVLIAIWVQATTGIYIVDKMLEFALSDYVVWPTFAVYALYFTGGVFNTFNTVKKKK